MDSPCDDNGQEVWTSQMIVAPAFVDAAAKDLATIGSAISRANAEALVPITALLPAGADDVSAAIAALFATHGQAYQELSAHAVAFHEQFVQLMSAGGGPVRQRRGSQLVTIANRGPNRPRCHQFTRADADRASAYRQRCQRGRRNRAKRWRWRMAIRQRWQRRVRRDGPKWRQRRVGWAMG